MRYTWYRSHHTSGGATVTGLHAVPGGFQARVLNPRLYTTLIQLTPHCQCRLDLDLGFRAAVQEGQSSRRLGPSAFGGSLQRSVRGLFITLTFGVVVQFGRSGTW